MALGSETEESRTWPGAAAMVAGAKQGKLRCRCLGRGSLQGLRGRKVVKVPDRWDKQLHVLKIPVKNLEVETQMAMHGFR